MRDTRETALLQNTANDQILKKKPQGERINLKPRFDLDELEIKIEDKLELGDGSEESAHNELSLDAFNIFFGNRVDD